MSSKNPLLRAEAIMTGVAVVVIVVAYIISRLSS